MLRSLCLFPLVILPVYAFTFALLNRLARAHSTGTFWEFSWDPQRSVGGCLSSRCLPRSHFMASRSGFPIAGALPAGGRRSWRLVRSVHRELRGRRIRSHGGGCTARVAVCLILGPASTCLRRRSAIPSTPCQSSSSRRLPIAVHSTSRAARGGRTLCPAPRTRPLGSSTWSSWPRRRADWPSMPRCRRPDVTLLQTTALWTARFARSY